MKEHEKMTDKQRHLYVFLIDYGCEVLKSSGSPTIGIPKDIVLEHLTKLERIVDDLGDV